MNKRYSPEGSSKCLKCKQGLMQASVGQTSCSTCPIGFEAVARKGCKLTESPTTSPTNFPTTAKPTALPTPYPTPGPTPPIHPRIKLSGAHQCMGIFKHSPLVLSFKFMRPVYVNRSPLVHHVCHWEIVSALIRQPHFLCRVAVAFRGCHPKAISPAVAATAAR